jgi:hypothetical protein
MFARWLSATMLLVFLFTVSACQKEKPKGQALGGRTEEEPPGPVVFDDITRSSGITFTYHNGEDTAKDHLSILESLGGGSILIDHDGDGLMDVFLLGGGGFAGKDKKEIVGYPCKLYRNQGKGSFIDVTSAVGLDKLAGGKDWFYTHGGAVADIDRDGWPDLLVTGWRGVALFRNVPVEPRDASKGRRFQDITATAGLDKGIDWATSAAFADLDGDGFADLYLCQYVDWSWKKHPSCSYDGKTRDVCPPKSFDGLPHKLYRNTGKLTFVDVSKEAGLRRGGPNDSKGLGVLIVDINLDGKPDIYVANDTTDNFLYVNRSTRGKLLFGEQGVTSGMARDDKGVPNGSMGLAAGDPERVGRPYIWVTNYENELHGLYRNQSKPGTVLFGYHTQAAGIAAIGQIYVGWGTAFIDVDLDGWEDLFVANGHAIRYPTGKGVTRKQRPILLFNQKGRFVKIQNRIGDYGKEQHLGRGVAFGDLDNDGRPDMVICNTNEPTAILRGIGGDGNHWVGVQLQGKDHADYVGARVTVETADGKQTRFATGGGSYASANDRRMLFGLGKETRIKSVGVIWPDGSKQTFADLGADRYHVLVQGEAKAFVYPLTRK